MCCNLSPTLSVSPSPFAPDWSPWADPGSGSSLMLGVVLQTLWYSALLVGGMTCAGAALGC